MADYKLFINGEWRDSESGEMDVIKNPATEAIVGTVQLASPNDVTVALSAAKEAQVSWRRLPSIERARFLKSFISEIQKEKEELAQLITREQGKLLKVARFEVDVTCSFIDYACSWARHVEGDILPSDNADEQLYIYKVPRGVVAAITAWNFPLALAGRKIGPALITGNTVVLKPTPEAPLSSMKLGELAQKAGLPDGVLNIVTGGIDAGKSLVASPLTNMVTMTGGTPTGVAIAKSAAQNLTHVQLELGGKAPCIIFDDADLDQAVEGALHSRFDNCGQVCTCNERMYVHQAIYDRFMEKFLARVNQLKVGDPMMEETDIGPKMNQSGLEHLEALVQESVAEGAIILAGGRRPEGEAFNKGYWYEPTILGNVNQSMRIVHEELFGPVLPVLSFNSYDEVIVQANDSEFGLAAIVFTNDMNKIMRLQEDLEFGEIYVNRGHGELHQGFHNGLKMSGTGGEDGRYGIEQYLEKKTTYIRYKR